MQDLSGRTIKGYQLGARLGEGAYGAVYRATQPQVGREVAIKFILPEYANQPDFIRRFEAEAQLVAQLEHLHIVPLYHYWHKLDGVLQKFSCNQTSLANIPARTSILSMMTTLIP